MRHSIRNVCYAAWTIAALVVIAHHANRPASAFTGTCVLAVDNGLFLLSDGSVVFMESGAWLTEVPPGSLPIAASEVVAFSWDGGPKLVDTSGNGWMRISGSWMNMGHPPGCDAISVEPTTWGAIKSRFCEGGN